MRNGSEMVVCVSVCVPLSMGIMQSKLQIIGRIRMRVRFGASYLEGKETIAW